MIILLGESASGKSTIEKELVKRGLINIVSYTTRPIRAGEIDSVDYHYISDKKFEELLQKDFFAEYTRYNGWSYGIAKEDCKDNTVVVVEPHGFRQLLKLRDINISSFYIKVSENDRLVRIAQRGDNIMEIFRRIISDQGVFQGIEEDVTYILDGTMPVTDNVEKILHTLLP